MHCKLSNGSVFSTHYMTNIKLRRTSCPDTCSLSWVAVTICNLIFNIYRTVDHSTLPMCANAGLFKLSFLRANDNNADAVTIPFFCFEK